ncbi:transposase, IS4 [Halococcus thailandensis JCM 13552]|uniref:Transposase, IS4 n=1 Tax=Halococcus thailandensis JCM 13552 TaxID=1227457 RepID=M0MV70_9EURY|nr:transposase, IS4 [Halococcus thailandensis JCM 13552]
MASFESVFSDRRNVTSFVAFVSAVIKTESRHTVSELARGISRPDADAKSGRTYRYFLGDAVWSAIDLAQHQAAYIFDQLDVGAGDEILLHIDDTHVSKTGDATDGVARLYNPVKGETELGNKFVTSCLQVGEIYFPYLARMYIKEELASDFDEPFKKKTEIAVEKIVTPLQIPSGAALTVVFDSAYYAGDKVKQITNQGYDVVCRYKSSYHVSPVGVVWDLRVDDFASTLEYEDVTITVRGRKKTYSVASEIVEIEGLGRVKSVTSKTDDVTRHYISTDLGRPAAEILELVEHRWNIETVHEESNKQFGFKQYELWGKQGIERYIQLVFLAWTLVTLNEQADVGFWEDGGGLSVRLNHAQADLTAETVFQITEEIDSSLPRAERREAVRERVYFYSWSSIANFFITDYRLYIPSNQLCDFYTEIVQIAMSQ